MHTIDEKIEKLINTAKKYMERTSDPVHDTGHVSRVVKYSTILADEMKMDDEQKKTLILAAWWHDVSRTITKKPSFIWMPLLDDLFSAMMLWHYTIKFGLFGSIAGRATRIIFCKSMGTGLLLTKILIRKKTRIMLDVLKDADMLDTINIERTKQIFILVEKSSIYRWGYKTMIWWFLARKKLKIKTWVAEKYLAKTMEDFINWITEPEILAWHENIYGRAWIDEKIILIKKNF